MMALLIGTVAVLVAAIVAGVVWLWQREVVDRRAAEQRLVDRARDEGGRLATLYERILTLREQQALDLVRLATTGSTDGPSARVEPAEPTAHEVLSRQISEDTITTGMSRMREEYQRAGIAVPDHATLREEVEMILAGALPPAGQGVLASPAFRS